MTEPSTDRLLNIEQVQDILNVGRSTVFSLIQSRQLRSVKIGHRRLVPASSVQQFIFDVQQHNQQEQEQDRASNYALRHIDQDIYQLTLPNGQTVNVRLSDDPDDPAEKRRPVTQAKSVTPRALAEARLRAFKANTAHSDARDS